MNFYKRHLGDIAKSCGDLSQGQMGAYDLLLDWHYANEKPIPLAPEKVYRIGRASTKAERDNVDSVLVELFTRTVDGYTHKRAAEEMEKANAQAEVNRRIAEEREAKKRARNEHEPCYETSNDSCTKRQPSQTPDSIKLQELPTTSGAESPPADPIWGTGLSFLLRRGIPEKQARQLLGKVRQAAGDIDAGAILARAEADDVSDPAPWLMTAASNAKARAGPKGSGATSKTLGGIQNLQSMKSNAHEQPRLAQGRDPGRLEQTLDLEPRSATS